MAPKHLRSGSESDGDEDIRFIKLVRSDSNSASSLATIVDLPFELRTAILDLATQRRPKSGEAVNGSEARERLRLDYGTIFNLSLTSRELHSLMSPRLWRHVKLTRPSALFEFRQALIKDPSKAELVKSLHVGPVDQLPKGWWPARYKDPDQNDYDSVTPIDLLKTSLGKREEVLRPRWCEPGKEWAYSLPSRTCQGAAVDGAIYSALEAVGIRVGDPEYIDGMFNDARGGYLGINEWTVRLFELQGVLDLYLCEMRRIEDVTQRPVSSWRASKRHPIPKDPSKCRGRHCGHYPRLVLEGFEGEKDKADKTASSERTDSSKMDTFAITREQVKAHLLRRGALTDNFEHPLLFARSGMHILTTGPGCAITVDHAQSDSGEWYESDSDSASHVYGEHYRYDDDVFSNSDFSQQGSPSSSPSPTGARNDIDDVFDLSQRDGITALCKSVLQRLPEIQNLSLSGFLFLSLGRSPPVLPTLRSFSLGPPTAQLDHSRSLDSMQLPGLEKLRICDDYLSFDVAKAIAGTKGEWKSLREARWDHGGSSAYGSQFFSLTTTIHYLQGHAKVNASSQPSPPGQQNRSEGEDEDEGATGEDVDGSSGRYIETRLHPNLISAILEKAPTSEVRKAWLEGLRIKNAPNRVRLVETQAVDAQQPKAYYGASKLHKFHLKESEQWWEECAWAIERGEQLTFK